MLPNNESAIPGGGTTDDDADEGRDRGDMQQQRVQTHVHFLPNGKPKKAEAQFHQQRHQIEVGGDNRDWSKGV